VGPRPLKTGTLTTYFHTHMRAVGTVQLRAIARKPLLAEHGIIDQKRFAAAVAQYADQGHAYPHVEALFCTLKAEQWLRAQAGVLERIEREVPRRVFADAAVSPLPPSGGWPDMTPGGTMTGRRRAVPVRSRTRPRR
jgi:hypothetical protein